MNDELKSLVVPISSLISSRKEQIKQIITEINNHILSSNREGNTSCNYHITNKIPISDIVAVYLSAGYEVTYVENTYLLISWGRY